MDLDEALYEARRTFSPPRELGSTPRSVRLTGSGWALVVGIGVIFFAAFLLGGILQRQVTRQAEDRALFSERGITTDATVTNLWRAKSGDDNRYFISYRFDSANGSHEGQTRVSSSLWRSLQTGAAVTIRYLSDEPSRSTLASGTPGDLPFWLPYLVGALIAASGLGCIWLLVRQRSLLIDGRVAPAVVTDVITRKTGHGTHRSIRYRFPLLSGAIATGKTDRTRKPPAVGTVLCVVYLPDEPGRNAPYPLPLVRPIAPDATAR